MSKNYEQLLEYLDMLSQDDDYIIRQLSIILFRYLEKRKRFPWQKIQEVC